MSARGGKTIIRACRWKTTERQTAISSSLTLLTAVVITFTVAASLVRGGMLFAEADTQTSAATGAEERQIIHLLNRLSYGPRPGDIERVKRVGLDKYLEQQLRPETIDDAAIEARIAGLDSLRMTTAEIAEKYPEPRMVAQELGLRRPAEAQQEAMAAEPGQSQQGSPADAPEIRPQQQQARQQILAYYAEHGLKPPNALLQELRTQKLLRAVYSERQLLEVMTDFWFNHFNVFWGKGADRWLTTDFEMHAIRPHAMGKFKDLLLATAKSPAMLFYLDNFLSSSPDAKWPARRGQSPEQLQADPQRQAFVNEQRQRQPGINENYARELMELHTMGVDGGYTQKDVAEVARCFTGWTIEQPRRGARFVFRNWMHDNGGKTVLGHKIPAGGGIEDGDMVIDILAHHPSTAWFVSTKLARRFVSDNPPPVLVNRLAAVYMNTDGDIREMLRTVFTSAEFYAAEAYRAKIKSPFELAVSAVRALDGDTDGSPRLAQFLAKMGQPLYQYPPPTGFPDRAEQWVNTGALLERLNFGLGLSANRIPGTVVDLAHLTAGIDARQSDRLMARAFDVLLHGDVSPQTRAILDRQLKEDLPVKGELTGESGWYNWHDEGEASATAPSVDPRLATVFGLVLGTPEFQRR